MGHSVYIGFTKSGSLMYVCVYVYIYISSTLTSMSWPHISCYVLAKIMSANFSVECKKLPVQTKKKPSLELQFLAFQNVANNFHNERMCFRTYSINPLIRTLVIRNANYPDRLGPSVKHFRTVTVLHLFMA